eukprot:TRINITY_DN49722_c0_g1_i1.p1 TRINITY_DN49722_c0_g1~~TRINITY_DN49722_c0_g1_i1.p1  ORF type:complete len:235 (-),score=16.10 TRINITY_DN49722_c0_g1_i1:153-857(-)
MRAKQLICLVVVLLACLLSVSADSVIDQMDSGVLDNHPHKTEEILEPIVPLEKLTEVPAPSTPHSHTLLLMESSCKIRNQWPKFRDFVADQVAYYPTISSKIVTGNPRFRFFADATDMKHATIDAAELSMKEMIEMLENIKANPDHYAPKQSVVDVPIPQEASVEQIEELLAKMGVAKSLTWDAKKRPILYEEQQELNNKHGATGPEPFDIDVLLKELDPNHVPLQAHAPKDEL